ncbi:MAG: magnesium transporter [Wenzhouxiangellaceae bacterium]|nr:magnesium transporter [Wenzhouxiangellaceae bacterium]
MADKSAVEELETLLRAQRSGAISEKLDGMAVQDIAHAISQLKPEQGLQILRALSDERQAGTFSYLSQSLQQQVLQQLSADEARDILRNLVPDDRTAFLESTEPKQLEAMLKLLDPDDLKLSLKLLGYPEESIGRLMTTRFVAVRPDWSVARALDHIRFEAHRGETINIVFVTDRRGRLLDAIGLKDFILARQDAKVETLMDEEVVSAEASADREQAVQIIQHYDISTLPVTDRHGVLLGIVTVDDVMDVAEQEFTEDFHKFGGARAVGISLRDARPSLLYRKRVGWLVILVLVNVISGITIAQFENAIEAAVALVFFLPMIIAGGGNAGSQSATLMVRALATGDVKSSDWLRLWGKELVVAAGLGLTLGLTVSAIGLWRGGPELGLVVALAMLAVVIVGAMLGMLLPFILQHLRMDPATASTPLITSIADVLGILIYFSIAVSILQIV